MTKEQLHKRLSDDQVKLIIKNYLNKEARLKNVLETLAVGKTRFFALIKKYRENPDQFTIETPRTNEHRKITKDIEKTIIVELKKEKKLIDNRDIPVRKYNYSVVREEVSNQSQRNISLNTIINRAKKNGFCLPKSPKKIHDREVITNYVGELVQHDSSYHQWSPFMDQKLYLITSIDDYSRDLIFADIFENESSWNHIRAFEKIVMSYGVPFKIYPDQHSIFRYVKNRDKFRPWHEYTKFTDDVDPQWKIVVKSCKCEVIYALSPQAKGKVERPYQWLQDRVVRACAKEKIKTIDGVRKILFREVYKYRYQWKHSTTLEIPHQRFMRAVKEGKTMFKPFKIPKPYLSSKDVFCFHDKRRVDGYRKIKFHNLEMKIAKASIRDEVTLKIIPDFKSSLAEIRFWCNDKFLGFQTVKHSDIGL